jgi:hypothetical protein
MAVNPVRIAKNNSFFINSGLIMKPKPGFFQPGMND